MSLVTGIVLPEGIALASDGRRMGTIKEGASSHEPGGVRLPGDNFPKINLLCGRFILAHTGYGMVRSIDWDFERDIIPWMEELMAKGPSIRETAALLNKKLADQLCGLGEKAYSFALGGYDTDEDLPCLIRYASDQQLIPEYGIREDDMFYKGFFCMGYTDFLNKVTTGEQLNFDMIKDLDSALNFVEFLLVLEMKCRTSFKGYPDCVGGRRFAAAVTRNQCGFVRMFPDGSYRFIDAPAMNPFDDILKEARELREKSGRNS